MRAHRGTLAEPWPGQPRFVLKVIGHRPRNPPYLWIGEVGDGLGYAYVDNANALRSLAHAILRALGDEPASPTKAKSKPRSTP